MTSVALLFKRAKLLTRVFRFNDDSLRQMYLSRLYEPHANYQALLSSRLSTFGLLVSNECFYKGRRLKHKKSSKKEDSDEESDSDNDEENDTKLVKGYVQSLRAEAVLKAGLGMARNKIEASFYESKIRINGKKLLKKSQKVGIGDELDLIRKESMVNPNFIEVSRIILVSAEEADDDDKILIKMKRYKTLTIENYDQD